MTPGQRPARRGRPPGGSQGRRPAAGGHRTVAQGHAEWAGLLRADGPFIAVPVLTDAFPQGLDTVPDDVVDKLRQR